MKIPFLILFSFISILAFGQSSLKIKVMDGESNEALIGVSIFLQSNPSTGGTTDENGISILNNLPNGKMLFTFSYVGYKTFDKEIELPFNEVLEIRLESNTENLDGVVITSTRASRSILNEPTRIEVIAAEELEEKANMFPANISMLLKESTGIFTQQTSALSANQNFRIQGLEGRYTQLLQNGFPLYGGLSSGLSLMQIPPLDLKQVEVIKGSSSTLYGGGAIAGLINLVTKKPQETPETSIFLNGTSAKGFDLNLYHAQKNKEIGYSIYLTGNLQEPFDPNKDEFSDLPQIRRFTINPRFYRYIDDKTELSLALNYTTETRLGGYIPTIKKENALGYTERNNSDRIFSQLKFDKQISERQYLSLKNSVSLFKRLLQIPNYQFEGIQLASFSEISYFVSGDKMDWNVGSNVWTDKFTETVFVQNQASRNQSLNTIGVFAQNTWKPAQKFNIETGLRTDYVFGYRAFLLPRISFIYKPTNKFTTRFGGGLGYKTPSVFVQESEEKLFQGILPLALETTKPETSQGINLDFNYKTIIGEKVSLSLNQFFFYTRLNNPLTLIANGQNYNYKNANGYLETRGFETQVKLNFFEHYNFFSGYTFLNTNRAYNQLDNEIPLTPKHRIITTVMYESEKFGKVGFETAYTGRQILNNNTSTRDYLTMGFMVEKNISLGKKINGSLYVNFENFTDVRQSRWQPMYLGTIQNPQFVSEIYAPTDGIVINGGIKMKINK